MSLATYRHKRHTDLTPEPHGKVFRRKGNLFVVQKHHARTLHYDLRLELDGVLKSWAVPKGPSLDPRDKRLAIEVEDHPLEYAGFEGTIPEGEYGAGSVIVWDRGTWTPESDARKGLRRRKLVFDLRGQKLHGRWALIGAPAGRSKQPQWFLIKAKDDEARPREEVDIERDMPDSVIGGRSVIGRRSIKKPPGSGRARKSTEAVKRKPKRDRTVAVSGKKPPAVGDPKSIAGAKRAVMPARVEPELATLAKQPPQGDQWLSEFKLDGYRIGCHLANGKAALYTRTGKDWTARFPAVAEAAGSLPIKQAVLDGEIVVYLSDGRSSFQALQNAMHEKFEGRLTYAVFDLLYLDGYDLRGAALEDRKRLLAEIPLPKENSHLQYLEHVVGRAGRFFRECCAHGLEGAICKRRGRPYLGGRGSDWLKIKCLLRQEFVIGGYTDSTNKRRPFGALLVGYHKKNGELIYAGRVGTGWQDSTMAELARRLRPLQQAKPPFRAPTGRNEGKVHWVRPQLVAEVAFSQWTRDGRLRQPSFQGLREDKPADKVVREEATT